MEGCVCLIRLVDCCILFPELLRSFESFIDPLFYYYSYDT